MYENEAADTLPASSDINLLDRIQARSPHEEATARRTQFEEQHTHPPLPRILVVEDDPDLATLEAGTLTAHGYTVVIVHSGELAVATLHSTVPDLVVLDLELTGSLDGWDVLQTLRTSTTVPVLLTTSSAGAVRQRLRSSGESRLTLDHLPKPYPMQILLKRVRRMLMTAS
jgi:DNA-binding response OmpR family regulator